MTATAQLDAYLDARGGGGWTSTRAELDLHTLRIDGGRLRRVVAAAGPNADERTPRELRRSVVSRPAGHSGTAVTEAVYRQQLRPVLEHGATVMDEIVPIAEEDEAGWSLS